MQHLSCVLNCFSCVHLFSIPMDGSLPGSLSMGFSRQEYWSGLPCPPPWYLADPRIEPVSLNSPALAGRFFTTSTTREAPTSIMVLLKLKTQGCPWWSSGYDFAFQCKECGFNPWWRSQDPTCLVAKKQTQKHSCNKFSEVFKNG